MVQSISILGSTGSIGRQTIAAAEHLGLKVRALAANSSVKLLEEQARRLGPAFVAVCDEAAARELRLALADTKTAVGGGMRAVEEAAVISGCDCVVTAMSGAAGVKPTLAAIEKGRRIALANKETLVCAGDTVMARAKECGAEIVPVDSEHSAIFQCLAGMRYSKGLKRILLTGSGGPFLGRTRAETSDVTPEMAVNHPNWSMGAKISVDSATLMNKGLEFIEAMHLFGMKPEDIQVVIHPQSVIHSMVEFTDGSVVAQMAVPDMELPIQYALTYPDRRPSEVKSLDLFSLKALTFRQPDLENFPCLGLAIDCAKRGGTAPAVMSAANEVAVGLFLSRKIGFNDIFECVAAAVDSIDFIKTPSLDDILELDGEAREFVLGRI